jgi:hypothetical protein
LVANKQYFQLAEFMLYADVDFFDTEFLQSASNAFRGAAADDKNEIPALYRQLQGIAVFDVHVPQHASVGLDQQLTVGHDTVYIENKAPDLVEQFFKVQLLIHAVNIAELL